MEEKKLNRKKIIIVSIILIIIIGLITFFVIRHNKSNVQYIAPEIPVEEQDDGMVKYENNINGIEIGERKLEKINKKIYIVIEVRNNTEEDKFDLPIGIEFVNIDGEVIYNTGHVVDVLLKGMTDNVYAVVTPHIAKLVEKEKIDHIVIKQLQ